MTVMKKSRIELETPMELSPKLRLSGNKKITNKAKLKLFQTYILSILLLAREDWTLTRKNSNTHHTLK